MKKLSLDLSLKIYVLFYIVLMLTYVSTWGFAPGGGEWPSYSFPVASILYEFDFAVSSNTLEYFKKLFPEYVRFFQDENLNKALLHFSGYKTIDGTKTLVWYFPIYAILALPFILFLKLINLPTSLGFTYLNVASIAILLLLIIKYIKIPSFEKIFLVILISCNPILFYVKHINGEPLIYSLIGISIVFWLSKKYYRSAFSISLAGAMNPIVMVIGFGIIFSFFYELLKSNDFKIVNSIKTNIISILILGLCFIVSILPMFYNYYHTGHINLSAGMLESFGTSLPYDQSNAIFARFIAYFTDLNFGFFAYYNLFLVFAFIMFVLSIFKKHSEYLKLSAIFLVIVFLYSLVIHINCGMSGIARYNAWSAVIIIFAVLIYLQDFFRDKALKIVKGILIFFMLLNFYIVAEYIKSPTMYVYFTKIAYQVLKYAPSLYNPLPSTFNSRVNHIDGGYFYETPIAFIDRQGYVRKILASKKDIEALNASYIALDEKSKEKWQKEIDTLTEKESYLNFRKNYKIIENK